MRRRTHIPSEREPNGFSTRFVRVSDLPAEIGSRPENTDKQVRLTLFVSGHKALPYSAPLPLRSRIPGTANRRSRQLGTAGKRSEQGGVPDERRRLRRSPVAPRGVRQPTESAQFSAPWTVSAALPPVGAREGCSRPPRPGQGPLEASGLGAAALGGTVVDEPRSSGETAAQAPEPKLHRILNSQIIMRISKVTEEYFKC